MAMSRAGADELIARIESETEIERVDAKAVAVLNRSEIEAQLDAAHKYRRSVTRFIAEAVTLATITQEVAESCIYSLPRDGKIIAGPSVRLAEICASSYGNLHVGARVVDETETQIVAHGVAWDLEKNLKITVETRRRITNRSGRRFSDDMITMTGNAAASIALRNAIFRVIPRAYVDSIYAKVREVAVGNARTLASKREDVVARLQKIGVPRERIFARVGKNGIEDIGLEELEILIGLGTAIKNGDVSIDDAFPPVEGSTVKTVEAHAEEGKRISLRGNGKAAKTPAEPASAPAASEAAMREPGEEG